MLTLRNFDLTYVKGVGPQRAKLLASELDLHSAYDLLRHYPTGYLDRSRTYTVRSIKDAPGEYPMIQLRGRFVSFNTIGEGASMRMIGLFSDGTATMDCVWFRGVREMRKRLATGHEYVLFGKPTWFNGMLQMTHPEEAIRVDFEFSDDRSFRVRLPCPYKAAADWTLVRDLEDSPSIRQVEVAYGL